MEKRSCCSLKNSERIFRVAVIGAESTGKTTLCTQLARHYHTVWIPEFSRNYIGQLNRKYTYEDVEICTVEQIHQEKKMEPGASRILFSDTEQILALVWFRDVFNKEPEWLENYISEHPFDLYLLTANDLAFQKDPLRENRERRDFFFDWYRKELDSRNLKYSLVKGTGNKRLQKAIHATENAFREYQRTT